MNVIYEKKTDDFYYRNDGGRAIPLQCLAHLHYYIEIVYVKSGRVQAYIDSEPYLAEEGDLLVVFPNKIHRFIDLTHVEYDLFIINPDIADELSEKLSLEEPENPVISGVDKNERIQSLIKILSKAKNFPKRYRETLMKGYMLAFFSEILEEMPLKSVKHEDSRALRAIVKYCAANFSKELSLTILENELHLSKYYISHLFGDKLGIRFNDYVNSLRISEACRLLRTTDLSITEVCDFSGFGTLRTFNRAFSKQMGVSPSDYKKTQRADDLRVSIPESGKGFGYDVPIGNDGAVAMTTQNEYCVETSYVAESGYGICNSVCDSICDSQASYASADFDDICGSVCTDVVDPMS